MSTRGKRGPRPVESTPEPDEAAEVQRCDGEHKAPICGDPQCWRDDVAAAEHTATCGDPECSSPGCVLKRAEVDVSGKEGDVQRDGDEAEPEALTTEGYAAAAAEASGAVVLPQTAEQLGTTIAGERIVATKVPSALSPEDQVRKAKELSAAMDELKRLEAEKTRASKTLGEQVKLAELDVERLKSEFDRGTEMRMVRCIEVPNYERKVWELRRETDRSQLVSERAMDVADLQRPLNVALDNYAIADQQIREEAAAEAAPAEPADPDESPESSEGDGEAPGPSQLEVEAGA